MFRKFCWFAILSNFPISRYVEIRCTTNNFTLIRRCNEIIWWKRWKVVSINWVHVFINCVSILENTNAEIFVIKVEDFTTASNKNFFHAFSLLIALHYVFNLLYTTQYIVVYQHGISKLFEHCENISAVWNFIHCFSLFRITKNNQNNCSKQP